MKSTLRTILTFALGALLGSPLVAIAEGAWKSVPMALEWAPVTEHSAKAPLFGPDEILRHDWPQVYGMTIGAHGYRCRASVVGDELSLIFLSDKVDGSGVLGMYEALRSAEGRITMKATVSTTPDVPKEGKDM